jgi:hypothetical protein
LRGAALLPLEDWAKQEYQALSISLAMQTPALTFSNGLDLGIVVGVLAAVNIDAKGIDG